MFKTVTYHGDGRTTRCDAPMSVLTTNWPGLTSMAPLFSGRDPVVDNNRLDQAIVECYLKIKNQKASIGNALAEATQAADMVAKSAITLVKLLRHARKGNFLAMADDLGLRGKDRLKLPASNYLQWKYGWAPLMGDIYDGMNLLKEGIPKMLPLIHAKKTYIDDFDLSFPFNGTDMASGYCESRGKRISKVQLWVTCNPDSWRTAALATGLDDPLGILWEVTPWSFVVDWVIPVGDVLSALSVMKDLNFFAGSWLTVCQCSNKLTLQSRRYPIVDSPVPVDIHRFGMRRDVMSSLPFPKPYVKSPFSTSHVGSAIALLTQLRR